MFQLQPTDPRLRRLAACLSRSYPAGPAGDGRDMERAIERGSVHDAETLRTWVAALVTHGRGWTDAVIFSRAWWAVQEETDEALGQIAELSAVVVAARDRRAESCIQGDAFVAARERSWSCPALARLRSAWDGSIAYPVAVGVTAAGHGIPLDAALATTLRTYVTNLAAAGALLLPLELEERDRLVRELLPVVADVTLRASRAPLDDPAVEGRRSIASAGRLGAPGRIASRR